MSAPLFRTHEKVAVIAAGQVVLVVMATGLSYGSSNHLGLQRDSVLTLAQVIPALLLALVFGNRVFVSENENERKNLSWGALSVLLVGMTGEAACFVLTGTDHYSTLWGPIAVCSAALIALWLTMSPLLASATGR